MNKVYKVVWNEVKNCYSVVSEIAKSHGKSSSRRKKTMAALMVFSLLSAGGLSYAATLTPEQQAVYDAVLQKLETEKKTAHYFSVNSTDEGANSNYNNDGATGTDAIAIGYNSQVKGYSSTALGNQSQAQGNFSTALGNNSQAQGNSSTALGNNSQAEGHASTALGPFTKAQGEYSTALGFIAQAKGDSSTALGNNSQAQGNSSTALGNNSQAEGHASTALGPFTKAQGEYSTALGFIAQAKGDSSTALGRQSQAQGNFSTALGFYSQAEGYSSMALGPLTKAQGNFSTALGPFTQAEGYSSTALGFGAKATGENSIALGGKAKTQAQGSVAIGMMAEARQKGGVALGQASLVDREAGVWGLDISTGQVMNEDTLLGAGTADYEAAKAKLTELQGQEQTLRNEYEASLAQDPVEPNGNHIPSAATQAIENQLKAKENEVTAQAIQVAGFVKVWQATKGAVSVGNTGLAATRQITNVAAGKEDTDAVNVAQLKKVAAMAGSATVDMEAGNNVTVNKDATTGKYKISAADTTLNPETNALSLSNGTLKLSMKDTKGNEVTGSVDLSSIQGAAGTGKTYTMTGTEDSANNTTTIALKDNNGNEQKVTVATKDTNTYTTKATYDAGSKKLTFTRNDNQTYDVDFSGIAGSITGDTRNTIAESNTIAVDSKNKNADGSTNYKLNVKTDGKVDKGNKGIVTGGTVFNETRIEKDGNYMKKDNTAGQNLSALDKQVGINTERIQRLASNVNEQMTGLDTRITTNTEKITANSEKITANSEKITANTEKITANTEKITVLNGRVDVLDTRVDRVGAGAAALAGLHPLDYDPENKWDFAAGYGNYKGANAIAVGAFYRPDENKMISIGGSFGGGENMVSAGVSVKLGQGMGISTSKVAMVKEIKNLKTENERMQAENKEMKQEIEVLKEQMQKLLAGK